MDLDHFKYVNDTLGHPIGDLLLREVVDAAASRGRRRAPDTVARLGGDEFAILLPGDGVADAQRVAAQILRALEVPMTLEGHIVDVRASIGIAVYPEHGGEARDAAAARRHRDVRGQAQQSRHRVWDERYDQHSSDRLSLMSDLRKAVDDDELLLVYQPKVALRGGQRALRRGAGALAASDARPGAADRIHPVRRADRLHPRDHAMGARARDRAMRGVARRRACR